jgi:hypothetical protein
MCSRIKIRQVVVRLLPPPAASLSLIALAIFLGACRPASAELPTLAPTAIVESPASAVAASAVAEASEAAALADAPPDALPATFTPPPELTQAPTPVTVVATLAPANTRPPVPTNTPVTPSPTPSVTPTPSDTPSATPDIRPLHEYSFNDVIPIEAFPRPAGDNGWGVHWIPTVKQEPAVVDRFVDQLVRMHIKWVVFLNDNSNIGDNDYLVDRLVDAGIMPVMRVFRPNVLPYDGDLGPMVAHYRNKGVYYFQLYNEPNVNMENSQGFANPNVYAVAWASAARDVINNGGLPGIGGFSPGGAFDHYTFLERTLEALRWNGDAGLLNRTWLSIHNYHGTRQLDDPGGFLLFRNYDEIIRNNLNRSMPMIGTEGGSYHPNPQVEKDLLASQYSYMRDAEPYLFAFTHWLLANEEGGAFDDSWEWQTLFRADFVHPLVTDFLYANRR